MAKAAPRIRVLALAMRFPAPPVAMGGGEEMVAFIVGTPVVLLLGQVVV